MENKLSELKTVQLDPADVRTESHRQSFVEAEALYRLAQFSEARVLFERIAAKALERNDQNQYFHCMFYLLRILLEQERNEECQQVALRVLGLIETKDISNRLLSRAHYTLGVLHYFVPSSLQNAKQYFQKAVDIAVASQDHDSLAYAIYGLANVAYEAEDEETCMSYLNKLDQILVCHPISDLQAVSKLLRAFQLRNQNQFDKALLMLKEACERLRLNPNHYLFLQALYGYGSTYLKMGELGFAQVYLELAKESCLESELPRLHRLILRTFNQCRTEAGSHMKKEAVFDPVRGTIEREGLGIVTLNSQFILRDLLALLLETPGKVFSKEELVEKVWQESYSPLVHDNKLYVTLKRLRQALMPLFPDVDPILRSRAGYSFNSQIKTPIYREVESV